MTPPFSSRLDERIPSASGLYHRLALTPGPARTGKTGALTEPSDTTGWPRITVNLQLAETRRPPLPTLCCSTTSRSFLSSSSLRTRCDYSKSLTRNRTLVAACPGSFAGHTLTYAEPGHRKFRQYAAPQAVIVNTADDRRPAGSENDPRRFVATFVFSDRMAALLCRMVSPETRFVQPTANKDPLAGGNYGCGKPHLMAVISPTCRAQGSRSANRECSRNRPFRPDRRALQRDPQGDRVRPDVPPRPHLHRARRQPRALRGEVRLPLACRTAREQDGSPGDDGHLQGTDQDGRHKRMLQGLPALNRISSRLA